MLPLAPPVTVELVHRWRRSQVPPWVTKAMLPGWWVAAVAASLITNTSACTPDDPAFCGPDTGLAVMAALAFLTPLLLWWIPLLGCLAGVVFGSYDAVTDPAGWGRLAFGAHACACAFVAGWLVIAARRQAAASAESVGDLRVGPVDGPRRSGSPFRRVLPVVVCLVAGVVGLGWYERDVGAENAHLDAAVRVDAEITAVDGDAWTITVNAADLGERTIDVIDPAPYRVGNSVPLLLDPTDPEWIRLVAEPYDGTLALTAALFALGVGAVFVGREVETRRSVRRLVGGGHPALAVRVEPDESGDALLYPEHGDRPFARIVLSWGSAPPEQAVEPPPAWAAELDRDFGQAWRGELAAAQLAELNRSDEPLPGVLIGELRDRGWAMVLTEAGPLVPARRLRLISDKAGSEDPEFGDVAEFDPATGMPGEPVPAAVTVPALPLVAHAGTRARLGGAAALVGASAFGVTAAAGVFDPDWWTRGIAVLTCGSAVAAGTKALFNGVRLTRERLVVTGSWLVREIPWEKLHGVRRHGDRLFLAWQPDHVMEVGPFDSLTLDPDQSARAEQVGGAMLALRARTLAAGTPDRPVRARLAPAVPLTTLYAVVALAMFWFTR